MTTPTGDAGTVRGRGRPRRINRDMIVRAARTIDPTILTMQAVADSLGVDRKALNYHISDREGLLQLLAVDAFHSSLSDTHHEVSPSWQEALRSFASVTRGSIIATGYLAEYLQFEDDNDVRALLPAEQALEALKAGGFEEVVAARCLTSITEFAFVSARDAIKKQAHGDHPQTPELRSVLGSTTSTSLEAMQHLMAIEWESFGDVQFEFDLRLVILGMERLLPS